MVVGGPHRMEHRPLRVVGVVRVGLRGRVDGQRAARPLAVQPDRRPGAGRRQLPDRRRQRPRPPGLPGHHPRARASSWWPGSGPTCRTSRWWPRWSRRRRGPSWPPSSTGWRCPRGRAWPWWPGSPAPATTWRFAQTTAVQGGTVNLSVANPGASPVTARGHRGAVLGHGDAQAARPCPGTRWWPSPPPRSPGGRWGRPYSVTVTAASPIVVGRSVAAPPAGASPQAGLTGGTDDHVGVVAGGRPRGPGQTAGGRTRPCTRLAVADPGSSPVEVTVAPLAGGRAVARVGWRPGAWWCSARPRWPACGRWWCGRPARCRSRWTTARPAPRASCRRRGSRSRPDGSGGGAGPVRSGPGQPGGIGCRVLVPVARPGLVTSGSRPGHVGLVHRARPGHVGLVTTRPGPPRSHPASPRSV